MRGSTEDERADLKTVTFLALRSLGPNGGEAVTRCDKTTLSNYCATHLPRNFMPVDVVRDIEARLGRPVISEMLVRQAGWKCVPDGRAPPAGGCLHAMSQDISDASAALRLAFKRCASDGLDAADRRELRMLIEELKGEIAEFERGL